MPDVPSLPARVLQGPRLAVGLTTAALVALASGGTVFLVAHGTSQLEPQPQAVPAPRPSATTPPVPVVVERAPGSLTFPSTFLDRGAEAVHAALRKAPPGVRRTVTAPLVLAPPPRHVVVPPPARPPVVAPPTIPQAPPPPVPATRGHGKHLGQLKHGRTPKH